MIKRLFVGAVAAISLASPLFFNAAPAHALTSTQFHVEPICRYGTGVLVTYRPQVGTSSWSNYTQTECITRWRPIGPSGSLLLDARIVSVNLNGMPGLKLGIYKTFVEGKALWWSKTITAQTDRSILVRGSDFRFEDSSIRPSSLQNGPLAAIARPILAVFGWAIGSFSYWHTAQSACATRNGVDCI